MLTIILDNPLSPYLIVRNAAQAIKFYETVKVFGSQSPMEKLDTLNFLLLNRNLC